MHDSMTQMSASSDFPASLTQRSALVYTPSRNTFGRDVGGDSESKACGAGGAVVSGEAAEHSGNVSAVARASGLDIALLAGDCSR